MLSPRTALRGAASLLPGSLLIRRSGVLSAGCSGAAPLPAPGLAGRRAGAVLVGVPALARGAVGHDRDPRGVGLGRRPRVAPRPAGCAVLVGEAGPRGALGGLQDPVADLGGDLPVVGQRGADRAADVVLQGLQLLL